MSAESAADRAALLDTDDFATAATYTLAAGGDTALNGIFDNGYLAVGVPADLDISATQPQFLCRTADLPSSAAQDDTITVDSVTWRVRELQPDGTGLTSLVLEKNT